MLWYAVPNKIIPLKLPAFYWFQATTTLCRKQLCHPSIATGEFHQWLWGIASYCWVPQTLYYCKSSTTPVNSTSLKWIYFCKMLEITLVTVFPDWHWKNYPLSGVHWLCLAWRLSILSLFLPSPSPPAHLGPQNIALVAWNLALVWMLERLGKKAAFCFSSMCVKDWNDAGGETVLSQEGVLVKRSQDIWKRQIQ